VVLINDGVSPQTRLVVAFADHFPGIALDSNRMSVRLELVLDKVEVMAGGLIYGELY